METMNRETAILEILGNLDETTLVQVWNNYCVENGNTEDFINDNEEWEINDRLSMMKPFDLLTGIDKYDFNDDYFVEGIYGIKSFSDVDDIICKSDLARAIMREETILTDSAEETEWEDTIIEQFEIFFNALGLSHEIDWEDEFTTDDLLTTDWADLVESISDKVSE